MLTLDKIYHAAYVLRDVVRKTDLILAPHLNPDCELYLKTENLQTTGSFKVRGAYYKISQLSDEEKELLENYRKLPSGLKIRAQAYLSGMVEALTPEKKKTPGA